MTVTEARAILADPARHDDAAIRASARFLMQEGAPEDIQRARQSINFGLRHNDPDLQKRPPDAGGRA